MNCQAARAAGVSTQLTGWSKVMTMRFWTGSVTAVTMTAASGPVTFNVMVTGVELSPSASMARTVS